jgi:glycosyltransferase involved in cell wall biosynthesis
LLAPSKALLDPVPGGRSSSEPCSRSSDAPGVIFLNPWDRLIGPNRYLVEMLRQAPELAARSTVVFAAGDEACREYRDLGCRTEVWPEIGLIHPRLTLGNVVSNLQRHTVGLARVVRRLKDRRPDLVVSNSEILCLGGMAARAAGIPHAQVVHSLLFQYRRGQHEWAIPGYIRFLSFWTQRFVTVSESVRRMLGDYRVRSERVAVVPNGFDIQGIRRKSRLPLPPSLEERIQGRYPVLVSVGRIAPMKGQDILIEAIARLRASYPSLLCLMVGRQASSESWEDVSGFQGRLTRRIRKERMEDAVCFLGEVDCVPELFRRADLYVHPSLTESFSRVVAEALICGAPVVCTDAGALPEVVGPGGAFLVKPSDAEALAHGVRAVLQGRMLRDRMVSAGQAHVENRYSIGQTTQSFLEVLRAMRGPGPGWREASYVS